MEKSFFNHDLLSQITVVYDIWNKEALGMAVLLFSNVWKPDEIRSTRS